MWLCVIVQEELAFVFEMLQQFEDALVQYDELDALFTQYVLNFGAGGKELTPKYCKYCFQYGSSMSIFWPSSQLLSN